MEKKGVTKRANATTARKTTTVKRTTKNSNPSMVKGITYNEKIFIENFINLQKAMTTLSVKFGELSQNITKLLGIFEESAKLLAKSEKQVDGHVTTKIDSLLEQNKVIAKGLVLMEDQFKRQTKFTSKNMPNQPDISKNSPQVNVPVQPSFVFQPPKFDQPNTTPQISKIPSMDSDRPKPLPPL